MNRFQKLSGAEFMQTSCWIYALVPNSISKRSWYLRTASIQQYLIQECLQSAPPLRRAPLMECWELALTDRQTDRQHATQFLFCLKHYNCVIWLCELCLFVVQQWGRFVVCIVFIRQRLRSISLDIEVRNENCLITEIMNVELNVRMPLLKWFLWKKIEKSLVRSNKSALANSFSRACTRNIFITQIRFTNFLKIYKTTTKT